MKRNHLKKLPQVLSVEYEFREHQAMGRGIVWDKSCLLQLVTHPDIQKLNEAILGLSSRAPAQELIVDGCEEERNPGSGENILHSFQQLGQLLSDRLETRAWHRWFSLPTRVRRWKDGLGCCLRILPCKLMLKRSINNLNDFSLKLSEMVAVISGCTVHVPEKCVFSLKVLK